MRISLINKRKRDSFAICSICFMTSISLECYKTICTKFRHHSVKIISQNLSQISKNKHIQDLLKERKNNRFRIINSLLNRVRFSFHEHLANKIIKNKTYFLPKRVIINLEKRLRLILATSSVRYFPLTPTVWCATIGAGLKNYFNRSL